MLIHVNITDRQMDGRTYKHIKSIVRNLTIIFFKCMLIHVNITDRHTEKQTNT